MFFFPQSRWTRLSSAVAQPRRTSTTPSHWRSLTLRTTRWYARPIRLRDSASPTRTRWVSENICGYWSTGWTTFPLLVPCRTTARALGPVMNDRHRASAKRSSRTTATCQRRATPAPSWAATARRTERSAKRSWTTCFRREHATSSALCPHQAMRWR